MRPLPEPHGVRVTTKVTIDPALALRSVAAYNRGRYRGRLNVTINRDGYERFRHGLSRDTYVLVEQLPAL